MFYFIIFIISLLVSLLLTSLIRKIAGRFKIVDKPNLDRKIHIKPVPLLGGVAIFLTFFGFLFIFSDRFLAGNLDWRHLLGFSAGALILVIGGLLDDKYNLRPHWQIVFPLLAVVAVIIGGVEIEKITNPLGGFIYLKQLIVVGPILIAMWLLGMMYTTKLLDGVDGLVTGVSAIGGLVIFLFTLTTQYYQPDIAFAALLLTAVSIGFLILNFHPAKIFLGEGGSLLLGYILGVLAIISGGKIAIALLIMGIPILDVVWTIIRRSLSGKNPFRFADKKHLHFRLMDLGLSQKQTVLVFYLMSLMFGLSGLFLQSKGKILALVILVIIMLALVVFFWYLDKIRNKKKPTLLLHICCAPCGSYVTKKLLMPKYSLTWYFCNPNICSQAEYNKRLEYVQLMAKKFNIPLIIEPYDHESWLRKIRGRENDPERGGRCQICYLDRLRQTVELAENEGFDFFSTTLLVSPYKDVESIGRLSRDLAKRFRVNYLNWDFQANNGYQKSQDFAKKLGIYRQKFCGCEYSGNYKGQ